MFYFRGLFLALISCILTACGGGKEKTVEAPAFTVGDGTFDTTTGRFTSSNGLTLYSSPSDPRVIEDGIPSVRQNAEGYVSVRAVSPSVFAIQSANIVSITDRDLPQTLGRFDEVQIPTVGSASLTGSYSGLLIANESTINQTVVNIISGDVTLNADFEAQTISGNINNRRRVTFPGLVENLVPMNDLVLQEASMNLEGEQASFVGPHVGASQGLASGGGFVAPGYTGGGIYSFVLGGRNDKTEAAALVSVTHRAPSGTKFDELGALLAFE